MRDLLLERAGRDPHAVLDAGHAVDLGRVRPGDVDHDRAHRSARPTPASRRRRGRLRCRIAATSALKRNAAPLASAARWALWRGELRVADIAGAREEHRRRGCPRRAASPNAGSSGRLGGPNAREVVERQARRDLLGPPVLPGDAERILLRADRPQMAVRLGLHDQAAGLVECGEPALVGHAQVARPVVPVEVRLVGERRAVEGRVVGADDRARARRSSRSPPPAACRG